MGRTKPGGVRLPGLTVMTRKGAGWQPRYFRIDNIGRNFLLLRGNKGTAQLSRNPNKESNH